MGRKKQEKTAIERKIYKIMDLLVVRLTARLL